MSADRLDASVLGVMRFRSGLPVPLHASLAVLARGSETDPRRKTRRCR